MTFKCFESLPRIGSGTVIALGMLTMLTVLVCCGQVLGWDSTWRTFGITPLQPPFFDMHVPLDYAACAARGLDPYIPHSCNPASFNIPPIWLWLGLHRLDGSDAPWLSVAMAVLAAGVIVALFKGRSAADGLLALIAILSPTVMMGVERGNADLLILTLVGGAALIYEERRIGRTLSAISLMGLAIVLKLFPMFSVALAARFNRRTVLFACGTAAISLIYLVAIFKYVLLIRANVPTTWILSYGYKAAFLGWDQLRAEAGLDRTELADTYAPIIVSALTLVCAVAGALMSFRCYRTLCKVDDSVAGTAFLFGSGIYCGTFLLGTNFVYRLLFLLLCLPQLLDWKNFRRTGDSIPTIEHALLLTVISVLWLNGNANGHSTFLFLPQVIDWLLFFGLAWVIAANFLGSIFLGSASRPAAR